MQEQIEKILLCIRKPAATTEENIRDHCDEKLYIFIKEKYIRTRIRRELAKDRLLKFKKIDNRLHWVTIL